MSFTMINHNQKYITRPMQFLGVIPTLDWEQHPAKKRANLKF